jgi:putative ABC transport system permease protein
VKVDSIGNMDTAKASIKTAVGEGYDVVPASEMNADLMQQSLDNIRATSKMSSLVALMTASVVMVFVMVLITRERIKEIGILKAIGFKNSKIISQFLTESMALATFAFVVGVLMTVVMGPYIATTVLGVNTTSGMPMPQGGQGGAVMVGGSSTQVGGAGGGVTILPPSLDFTINSTVIFYTLIITTVLGIIGALYPVLRAIKLKPAEALRFTE